ncbi:hypothetical protein [Paludibaculum fermentans]|uniref:hypothetical protein n=1 Tax=Paludibaculum fermentans TaxID=1473598 RepID=UPI003EBE7D93
MSASILLSANNRWDVPKWIFHQFFDDIRAAYPANKPLCDYLEQIEPILHDDLNYSPDEAWVARVYNDVAKRIVSGDLVTSCNAETRLIYISALRTLSELFEADGRFAAQE